MDVSVVIPVFNAMPWLEEAVQSLFSQTGVSFEAIFVDDGSTDSSPAFLAKLSDRRLPACDIAGKTPAPRHIRILTQPNAGQGAARNRGLELATGRYVYFMDADDALAGHDALRRMLAAADRDNLDVLMFDATVSPPSPDFPQHLYSRRHDYSAPRTGAQLAADLFRHNEYLVSPWQMLIRREFLTGKGIRFPEGFVYEDNIFQCDALVAAPRAAHLRERLYVRRVRENSTMTSPPSVKKLHGDLACAAYFESVPLPPMLEPFRREQLRIFRQHVRQFLRLGIEIPPGELSPLETATLEKSQRTSLPDKFWNLVRCLRENGLAYTLRRLISQDSVNPVKSGNAVMR